MSSVLQCDLDASVSSLLCQCHKQKTFSTLARLMKAAWHNKWLFIDAGRMTIAYSKDDSMTNSKNIKIEVCWCHIGYTTGELST